MHFPDRPPLTFEILPTGKAETDPAAGAPRVVLTNLHQSPLTAIVLDLGSFKPGNPPVRNVADALQNRVLIAPIPRGLSYVGAVGGINTKDGWLKPKLLAAVWEDGSTWGPDDAIDLVFAGRRSSLAAHEEAIKLLQSGLDKQWTLEQFQSEIETATKNSSDGNGNSAREQVFGSLGSTYGANVRMNRQPLDRLIQYLIRWQTEEKEKLQAGLPQEENVAK